MGDLICRIAWLTLMAFHAVTENIYGVVFFGALLIVQAIDERPVRR